MADTRLFKMKIWKKFFDNWFAKKHMKFDSNFKKSTKMNFFQTFASWDTKLVRRYFFFKFNKHTPVLDIVKNKSVLISGIAEIWPWKSAMWS